MLIEALRPLRVRLRDGEWLNLKPGEPAEVPDTQARRLLAKAGDKVRVLSVDGPLTGQTVSWNSPLFGLLSGIVLREHGDMLTVRHPLTDREATIPRAWVTSEGDALAI